MTFASHSGHSLAAPSLRIASGQEGGCDSVRLRFLGQMPSERLAGTRNGCQAGGPASVSRRMAHTVTVMPVTRIRVIMIATYVTKSSSTRPLAGPGDRGRRGGEVFKSD